ncbi:LpqB family beta-propeller domain-containing protein [Microbacterium sp. RD1]|uniref:LpqB family beta-propeller domain-containing protein n=1 Tax=Microbacterium sp. RD1 TaxID=3457313 RepID=UPI003FA5BC38
MRRAAAAVAAAVLALLLAACTGLPTSGAVYPGLSPVEAGSDPDIRFIPNGPQPGSSPEDIVSGFIRAGSGPQDGWRIAREFLTADFARRWDPRASVTIDRLADRSSPTVPVDGVSTVQIAPTGLVDGEGAYAPQGGATVTLSFSLVEEGGQWRIAAAPDGIVLFEEEFDSVFRAVSLVFFDPSWQFLVPDVRWYPSSNIATYVAAGLIEGAPSPWLQGAVFTAFPDEVTFDAAAVPVTNGVAEVELDSAALSLGQAVLDRMQAQLEASLRDAGIANVRMTVGGTPLDARPAAVRSTRVESQSLVELADGRFGFLDGDEIEGVPDLSEAIESVDALAVEAGPSLDVAAVKTSAGVVLRAAANRALATLDERPGLIDPTIDPSGTVWSVPGTSPGAVRASPIDGQPIAVTGAWASAVEVSAMRVSRDGARMAAAVTVGGHTEVWVAGIRRAEDDTAFALGETRVLASLTGDAIDLAWLDDTTLGVLTDVAGEVSLREQAVGGPGVDTDVPAGVTSLVGGNSSARLHAADGTVYVRQGPNWAPITDQVRVLAGQQGML